MKRSLITLAAALLLLAAVAGVKIWRDGAASRPAHAFAAADTAGVEELRIVYQGDSVVLARSGAGWMLARAGLPADTARLARVFAHLLGLETREKVSLSRDTARLMEYSLNPGDAKRVEWRLAGGARRIALLGKTSGADYESTYWKLPGEDGVYRTPGSFTHEFSLRAVDWMERALFPPFGDGEVRALEVAWIDSTSTGYRLEAEGDSLRIAGPVAAADRAALSAKNASALYARLRGLAGDDFLAAEDPLLPTVLPDSVTLTVRLELRDGGVRVLKAGPNLGGYRYARHPAGGGSVVRIGAARLDALRLTHDQLLAPLSAPGAAAEEADPEFFDEDMAEFPAGRP